jgi:hypothetical protein
MFKSCEGLLFVNFILHSVYSYPFWGKNSAEKIWRLKSHTLWNNERIGWHQMWIQKEFMCQMHVHAKFVWYVGHQVTKQNICAIRILDKGLTNLWEYCECSRKEFEEWHKLECPMEIVQIVEWPSCPSILMNVLQMLPRLF